MASERVVIIIEECGKWGWSVWLQSNDERIHMDSFLYVENAESYAERWAERLKIKWERQY